MAISTGCGDWMRGWGYGGYNKIGRLTKTGRNTYQWKGKAQGRHNNTLRSTWTTTFTLVDGKITEPTDSLPSYADVYAAIEILNK